jgi:hypothetical protein
MGEVQLPSLAVALQPAGGKLRAVRTYIEAKEHLINGFGCAEMAC